MTDVFVCYSRCLYCGRRTPHEVCHRHRLGGRVGAAGTTVTARLNAIPDEERQRAAWGRHFDRAQAAAWRRGFGKPPEVCEDPKCPQNNEDWR